MTNIEKLKQYQRWRSGVDERPMPDAVPFDISEAINGVIAEYEHMANAISITNETLDLYFETLKMLELAKEQAQ